jgi:uncharacterized protein YegJ (DUF2314 family)
VIKHRLAALLAAFALTAALTASLSSAASAQSGSMIRVPNDDPEMAAAIAKARASLPAFWQALEQPGPGEEGFALKVAVRDGADVEHFWLIDVARADGKLSGTVNNEPEIVGNVANGERYEFSEADISDWLFQRNGKMVGNETLRPLLKRMPKGDAEYYRALYETP